MQATAVNHLPNLKLLPDKLHKVASRIIDAFGYFLEPLNLTENEMHFRFKLKGDPRRYGLSLFFDNRGMFGAHIQQYRGVTEEYFSDSIIYSCVECKSVTREQIVDQAMGHLSDVINDFDCLVENYRTNVTVNDYVTFRVLHTEPVFKLIAGHLLTVHVGKWVQTAREECEGQPLTLQLLYALRSSLTDCLNEFNERYKTNFVIPANS